jgi:transposase
LLQREEVVAQGDLTDVEWAMVGPLLAMERGRPARDDRLLLDGILWRAREGATWRAMPERYGKWNTVWRRFARWRDLGVFEAIFAALAGSGAADERVQMVDGSTVRAHQHAAGGKTGERRRRWAAAVVASRPSCTSAATHRGYRSTSISRPDRRTRLVSSTL